MGQKSKKFKEDREKLNSLVMKHATKTLKRFYNVDAQAYQGGALPSKTKELLGLVASLVLRCDDCIRYHLGKCKDEKVTDEELGEALTIGLVAGGSITIPHIRRAYDYWEDLKE